MSKRLSSSDRRLAVVVFSSAVLVGLPGAFFGLPWGKNIEGAARVLAGEVPYRDFWTMYAPGHFYATAGVFWLFGKEVIAQAIMAVLAQGFGAWAFFTLLLRVGIARSTALALSVVFVGMFWTTSPVLSSYPIALPILLVAVERLVVYYQGGGGSELRRAGLLIGLAAWFKHDVAGYVAAGAVGSLLLSWMLVAPERRNGWLRPPDAALRLILSTVPLVAAMGLWLGWVAGMHAWEDLIVFPATVFRDVRGETYPPLLPPLLPVLAWVRDPVSWGAGFRAFDGLSQWILCHMPELTVVTAAIVLLRRRRDMSPANVAIATLCLTCIPLFWTAAHVQRNTHLYSMAIFSLMLGALAWEGISALRGRWTATRFALLGALSFYVVGLSIPPSVSLFRMVRAWPESRSLDVEGIRGIRLRPAEFQAYEPLSRLVRERTRPDERIYHGVLRHESIVINNPIVYTVAGRRSCCRYPELHPGVTDRTSVQREIIEDIERQEVRAVILWKFGWSDEVLDRIRDVNRAATPDGGSTILNEFIARHFVPISEFGQYVLMWRDEPSKSQSYDER